MRFILLLIICICFISSSRGQIPFTKELWLNDANTPVKVNDLLYEPHGYIWLATDAGLYRFNGRSFTLLPDSTGQPVTALAATGNGVYAGYKSGQIGRVDRGLVKLLKFSNRFPASAITSLQATGNMLWATTEDEGLFLFVNSTGVQLSVADGLTDNFIYDATIAADKLLLSTDRGINRVVWKGDKPEIKSFTTEDGLPDNIVRVIQPVAGTALYWLGTQEGGVALYNDNDKVIIPLPLKSAWVWGQVNDILPVSSTEAWVATDEGYMLHIHSYEDSVNIMPVGYTGLKLNKIIKDKADNIWCATNKGLMLHTGIYMDALRWPAGFHLQEVTAVTIDRNNNLWFTQNKELFRLPLTWPLQPQHVLSAATAITCLYADAANNLWIGTFGRGLYCHTSKGVLTSVKNIGALIDGHILSITGIGSHIWIASLNGVEETVIDYSQGVGLKQLKHHNKSSGTGSDYIYQLYADGKGRIWMATDGAGVCMYDGRKYHRWDSTAGLTSNVIYSVTEDRYGYIWVGTLQDGLFCYRDGKWQQVLHKGTQNLNITSLKANATGQLLVVNEEGIDQWFPADKQFRHYNRRLDVGIDTTSSILNCITADTSGNVYVPFEQGFIRFKNISEQANIIPDVKINAISLFLKQLSEEPHHFRHDENHVSFHFDGLNFINTDILHYRYKLQGGSYDDSWLYTNDEIVSFTQLPPGNYTFRLQVSLSSNFTNAAEASYHFSIAAPFWQRTWFIIIASLLLLGLGYLYVRIRERSLRNRARLQRERMIFEYEHLKSQVNPHFLFNSLNTLVSLIDEDKAAAVDYTIHLSDLYRNMLSYKDQDLISLAEEYKIITNYMHVQQSRFGAALQLQVDIPEQVLNTRKIIPLALQLLIENAIKHNIASLAVPLVIHITATEDEITVRNILQPKISKEKASGLGLVNIKKRYSLLTGRTPVFTIEGNEYIVILPLL